MLCGCTTTSMRSMPMPNSQRASIISRPLLKSVAESMVIFGPMFQVGWQSACSGVTLASSFAGNWRKGPPDAVRMSRETSALRACWPLRHWKMALCSLSTGRSCTPFSSAARVITSPAITRISFDAIARSLPALIAARAGKSPAVPTIETSTMSVSARLATSMRPSGPV